MTGKGWHSLMNLAELAVNTRLAPTQESTPYELAMAREPRLLLDVNLEGIQAEEGIEPIERLNTWACIRNLEAHHRILPLPSYHELLIVAVSPLPLLFRPNPMRGLVYKHITRKPRFYIALGGGVILAFFAVQLWILRRVIALHVAPS
ncbi:hypothetical protein EXIGLDRAFT_782305 [Exidia glandulosa HHB12029]|uniref:Uncharacterized protein n=1 Tax=Exidia glandulosa HHB12029 TaxID=1314781 RepID=A0A165AWB4_EXIGL|nr:hypothetical protein EXIGLDRAFT_782305 [Exidia glandulosa HHB12029]